MRKGTYFDTLNRICTFFFFQPAISEKQLNITSKMGAKKEDAKSNNGRKRFISAIVLVLLMAVILFAVTDVPFIKSARDSLMQKLGYEAIDQGTGNEGANGNEKGSSEDEGSENNGVKTAEHILHKNVPSRNRFLHNHMCLHL